MDPGASIIVVTFNSADEISQCLLSAARTLRPQDEIVVVDNHSQDNTLEVIDELDLAHDGRIQILPQTSNLGFSRGCNIGIENSNKEFVILLNPDTVVFEDWIAKLTNHFHYYENTGAVGPLSNSVVPTQHIITYFPEYDDYLDRARDLIAELDVRFGKRSIPTNLLIGFCLALRRDLIELYGSLDDGFFLGIDDLELSWRLRKNGQYLRVALDVFVNHLDHKSFNSLPENVTNRHIQEGSDLLYDKMQSYHAPAKVPHPLDYFGISWWKPSVLTKKSEIEVFSPKLTEQDYKQILVTVKSLVRTENLKEAADLLEAALKFYVRDAGLWYTLGSIYTTLGQLDHAEFALMNAWSLEFAGSRAITRLRSLLSRRGQKNKYRELIGSE